MFVDEARHDRRPHDLEPDERQAQAIRVDHERQPARGDEQDHEDRLAGTRDGRLQPGQPEDAPARKRQDHRRQSPQDAAVHVGPGPEDGDQPEQPASTHPTCLEIAKPAVGQSQEHDRADVRANVQMVRARRNRQHDEEHSREPVQAATEKAVGGPGVKAGQDRGRCQQEGVQATDSVKDGHQAFPEPLISYPRLAAERERERIGVDEPACRENPVSRRRVPERPRIAEEPAASADHEEQPDSQGKTSLSPPEPFQHSRRTLAKAHSPDSRAESSRLGGREPPRNRAPNKTPPWSSRQGDRSSMPLAPCGSPVPP